MESNSRQKRIIRNSIIGIIVNLCIAILKIVVGSIVSSLAIVSEGMNNATDASSAFLTLVGTKLSSKHPDHEHPFGYGRIEYLTSLTVSILILYTGINLIKSSVDGILHPSNMEVTIAAIILVAVSAFIKFLLGAYTIAEGKKLESSALIAIGVEGRNDSLFSLVTIGSSILYLTMHLSLDAWAGVLFAFVIIKSGFEILKDTVSELIGKTGDTQLAKQIYKDIRSTKGILNAADMMLHNYGPDHYSGSVNIEIDHKESIGDIYEYLHELQLSIMYKYHVTMVFGIYAVDNDREQSKEMRKYISQFVLKQEHLLSYHALYLSKKTNKIYCDFIVDYDLEDWEQLRKDFSNYMKIKYPENEIDLTIETEFV